MEKVKNIFGIMVIDHLKMINKMGKNWYEIYIKIMGIYSIKLIKLMENRQKIFIMLVQYN